MFSFLKSRKQRQATLASAVAASEAANSLPSSGLTFVDNSQGASAAVQELLEIIEDDITEINLEGRLDDRSAKYANKLNDKASEYANCSVRWCASRTEWSCNPSQASLISAACICAAGAYRPEDALELEGYSFDPLGTINPSVGGSTKQTTITLVKPSAAQSGPKPEAPVLMIAVRGTASAVDHVVNLNGKPVPADEFFGFPTGDIQAHKGFLAAASALEPSISEYICKFCRQHKIEHVLFTGHSAGGAVASLLCLYYRRKDLPLKFSCITFGSPPVMRSSSGVPLISSRDEGLWINIINEYDMVSRADETYIRALVDVLRSIYGRPPLEDAAGEPEIFLKPLEKKLTFESQSSSGADSALWKPPEPLFSHLGTLVIFQLSPTSQGAPALKAWWVPWEEFSQLLFTSVEVHGRRNYLERTAQLSRMYMTE